MNGSLLVFALVLGLAVALPNHNIKSFRNRTNAATNRLGIYDGTSTTINKHNYLVGIVYRDSFYCAGAILSESYVLTTGLCAEDVFPSNLTVVAGSSDGTTGTSYSVKTIVLHPDFDDFTESYNFALLEIDGTFAWGTKIGKVTLPSRNPNDGAALVAVGYGDTSAAESVGEGTLMQGTMNYMTALNCQSYYRDYDLELDTSMACAYNEGKTTMCEHDVGNPFTKGRVLYGLMSDGGSGSEFCDATAIPVIISNIYTVVDWIKEYI